MYFDNEKIKVGVLNFIEVWYKGVGILIIGCRVILLLKYEFCCFNYFLKRFLDVLNYEGCFFIVIKLF